MRAHPSVNWPPLPLAPWADTRDTLLMWLQIVGKIRLRHAPPINHSWHSTLYLTARGLTTSLMPHGQRTFQINLDAYPEPDGFADARVVPDGAFYSAEFREFVLPYDIVRTSSDPDATLLAFLQSTYDATAMLGQWDGGLLR